MPSGKFDCLNYIRLHLSDNTPIGLKKFSIFNQAENVTLFDITESSEPFHHFGLIC